MFWCGLVCNNEVLLVFSQINQLTPFLSPKLYAKPLKLKDLLLMLLMSYLVDTQLNYSIGSIRNLKCMPFWVGRIFLSVYTQFL